MFAPAAPLRGVQIVALGLLACLTAPAQERAERKDGVVFRLQFLQLDGQARSFLAQNRQAVRRAENKLQAFESSSIGVHLLENKRLLKQDLGGFLASGNGEDLQSVRLMTQYGQEALWLVGNHVEIPSLPVETPVLELEAEEAEGQEGLLLSLQDPAPPPGFEPVVRLPRRDFGVRLSLLPTPLPEGRVRVRVRTTARSVDFGESTIRGKRYIPALKIEQADKHIDLEVGQSFAITGAASSEFLQRLERIPGLEKGRLLGKMREHRSRKPGTEMVLFLTLDRAASSGLEEQE